MPSAGAVLPPPCDTSCAGRSVLLLLGASKVEPAMIMITPMIITMVVFSTSFFLSCRAIHSLILPMILLTVSMVSPRNLRYYYILTVYAKHVRDACLKPFLEFRVRRVPPGHVVRSAYPDGLDLPDTADTYEIISFTAGSSGAVRRPAAFQCARIAGSIRLPFDFYVNPFYLSETRGIPVFVHDHISLRSLHPFRFHRLLLYLLYHPAPVKPDGLLYMLLFKHPARFFYL